MFVTLIVVHVLVCLGLIMIVLLQSGRGAELGAAFGGIGQATYSRGQQPFIAKFTSGLAVVFMATSLILAILSTNRPSSSVMEPIAAPPGTTSGQQAQPEEPAQQAAPQTEPVAPAPGTQPAPLDEPAPANPDDSR